MKEYTSLVRTLFGNNPVIYKNYDYIMHESDLRNLFEYYRRNSMEFYEVLKKRY